MVDKSQSSGEEYVSDDKGHNNIVLPTLPTTLEIIGRDRGCISPSVAS